MAVMYLVVFLYQNKAWKIKPQDNAACTSDVMTPTKVATAEVVGVMVGAGVVGSNEGAGEGMQQPALASFMIKSHTLDLVTYWV